MSNIETGQSPVSLVDICLVSRADICPVSAADICPVSTADICPVSTEDISPVSTEDGACPDTVGMGCSQKNLPPWKRGVAVTKPERSYLANPHMMLLPWLCAQRSFRVPQTHNNTRRHASTFCNGLTCGLANMWLAN